MMVEAEIHAVMQFAFFQRFAQGRAQLAPLRVIQRPHRGARLPIGSVVPVTQPPISGFPHPRQNLIRNLAPHLIFHRRSLLFPRARSRFFPFSVIIIHIRRAFVNRKYNGRTFIEDDQRVRTLQME